MRFASPIRTLLILLLAAAQPVTASFAAQAAARGAPCPVHAALLSPAEDRAAAHHGHAAPGEPGEDAPAHFTFACCAAHAIGIAAEDAPLLAPDWTVRPVVMAEHGLEPGELPAVDPPPRNFL